MLSWPLGFHSYVFHPRLLGGRTTWPNKVTAANSGPATLSLMPEDKLQIAECCSRSRTCRDGSRRALSLGVLANSRLTMNIRTLAKWSILGLCFCLSAWSATSDYYGMNSDWRLAIVYGVVFSVVMIYLDRRLAGKPAPFQLVLRLADNKGGDQEDAQTFETLMPDSSSTSRNPAVSASMVSTRMEVSFGFISSGRMRVRCAALYCRSSKDAGSGRVHISCGKPLDCALLRMTAPQCYSVIRGSWMGRH